MPGPNAVAAPSASLLVFAPASTAKVMRQLTASFEQSSGVKVQVATAGSNQLARQILAGAEADLFLSADERWMDRVDQAGLVLAGTRRDLLSNRLVIVTSQPPVVMIRGPQDLIREPRIAVADPNAVPEGRYARQWLQRIGLWAAVAPKLLPTLDARSALAAVEMGAAPAGILYETDARLSSKVAVAYRVPRDQEPPIAYPLAILRHGAKDPRVRSLYQFLAGATARRIFQQYGFELLTAP